MDVNQKVSSSILVNRGANHVNSTQLQITWQPCASALKKYLFAVSSGYMVPAILCDTRDDRVVARRFRVTL